ncbi:EpsG family protein [Pedobacter suwonensis]|uniref:EpsG family protein n=1 Tax=Pedobacter suwonensis TaxID=332999 RepID=A0A1I0SRW2_9SPHI|nr:EpsG family protein [Pedobacter suwonensis]SFA42241.1 EpsG family protein [Pedobacter suwonensis]
MVLLIFTLFLFLSFLALFEIKDKNTEILVFMFCSLLLILFAGFRGEGMDRDYANYKEIFLNLTENSTYYVEPGFIIITKVVNFFSGTAVLLFLLFAILAVTIKSYAISKLSDFLFVSLLIYFSNIYILNELTQIRAGVASGLLLLSIVPLQAKKNYKFFLIAFTAVLFHLTSLVLFLIWFLDTDKINKKVWFIIIPLSYIALFIGLSPIDLYKLIPIESIQAKINTYILLQESGDEKVNVISTLVLLRLVVIFYLLKYIDKIQVENKYAIVLTKIYIISLAVLIVMSRTAAVALRFNEFFVVVEMFTLPLIIYTFPPKLRLIPRIIIVVFAAVLLFFHFRSKTLLIFE